MTTVPEPARPFVPGTEQCYGPMLERGALLHLADNAERYTTRAADHNDADGHEEVYAEAVCDVLRWLAGDRANRWLTRMVAD